MDIKGLKISLLLTRLATVYFMAMWGIERFTNVDHAMQVANKYYNLGPIKMSAVSPVLVGTVLMLTYLAVLVGFKKKYSYGLMFLIHLVGTLISIKFMVYGLADFRLIFIASIPALMAMLLLWVLREEDTLLTLKGKFS